MQSQIAQIANDFSLWLFLLPLPHQTPFHHCAPHTRRYFLRHSASHSSALFITPLRLCVSEGRQAQAARLSERLRAAEPVIDKTLLAGDSGSPRLRRLYKLAQNACLVFTRISGGVGERI